jgi:raffinose/stachyose/melibiose transport system permease protein
MKSKERISNLIMWTILFSFSVGMLFPFIWVIITSFKDYAQIFSNPWELPKRLNFENYYIAWTKGLRIYLLNTFINTLLSVIFIVAVSSLSAYAFAKLKLPAGNVIFVIIVSGMLLPSHSALIPLYNTLSTFGLLDTRSALILPYVAYGIPFSVLLLSTFFASVPNEIEASAKIDGCSHWMIYLRIMLPLSRPALASVVIFNSVWVYNEFLFALTFIKSEKLMTIPLGLTTFKGAYVSNWPAIMAGVVLATLPLTVIYLLFQRHFVAGLTEGAVKG